MTHRAMPDHMALTVWGMGSDPGAPPTPSDPMAGSLGIWGEGAYAIDIDADDARRGRLILGTGDLDLQSLDERGSPALAIVLDQPVAPEPGARRTLLRDDFGAARVEAMIDGTRFVDAAPRLVLALDLATGATEVSVEGLLVRVDGAPADDRSYAVDAEGITPLDCVYRPYGVEVGGTWMPPEGQVDVCRALVSKARRMPPTAETPALPWNPEPPAYDTVCGL